MKRFITEIVVTIAFIFLSGYFLYHLYAPLGIPNEILNIKEKLEIVNFGTSHGGSFDYRYSKLKGAQVKKAGNTLYYDLQNYRFLKSTHRLAHKAIVIIPISYLSFGVNENRKKNSFVNDYYYYLPKEQIFEYSAEKNRRLTLLTIQNNFSYLFFPPEEYQEKKLKITFKRSGERAATNHQRNFSPIYVDKNIGYLETLIQEAINNKDIPILVSVPYHNEYNSHFTADWLNENYYNIIEKISVKFNVPYLDYSHDKRFSFKQEYFKDGSHLNREGKKKFSLIVFDDIQKMKSE